ncbi:MAG TPA: hypothetical protein VK211_22165 [Kamptonema sp.]|nr:hypothetical protein [Kamptonema sp.]
MADISSTVWLSNLGTYVAAYNTTVLGSFSPAALVFNSAEAYRESQETYNADNPGGPFINFATAVDEAPDIILDAQGNPIRTKSITLRGKTVYTAGGATQPQTGTTII